MEEKEKDEFSRECNIITELLYQTFRLKEYSFAKMFSVMAYVIINMTTVLAHHMQSDTLQELDKFLAYLSDIRKQMTVVKDEQSNAS